MFILEQLLPAVYLLPAVKSWGSLYLIANESFVDFLYRETAIHWSFTRCSMRRIVIVADTLLCRSFLESPQTGGFRSFLPIAFGSKFYLVGLMRN